MGETDKAGTAGLEQSGERLAVASDPSHTGKGANIPRRHVSGMQEAPFLGSAWQGGPVTAVVRIRTVLWAVVVC